MALTGAVVLASGSYAIGSQTGGGEASAAKERAREMVGVECLRPGFGGLARRLGVDASDLRRAFDDFGSQHSGDRRTDFLAALADALGVSQDRVADALRDIRPPAPPARRMRVKLGPPAEALAEALDMEPSRVREAFREMGREMKAKARERPDELASFLAERLDKPIDEVKDALGDKPWPGRVIMGPLPPRHHGGFPGPPPGP
jgi:hypothetical protein